MSALEILGPAALVVPLARWAMTRPWRLARRQRVEMEAALAAGGARNRCSMCD